MKFFFFNYTPTTDIYTLSLHDALPIWIRVRRQLELRLAWRPCGVRQREAKGRWKHRCVRDRKSTRLNSSHPSISYAVFCLKKKKADWMHEKRIAHRPFGFVADLRLVLV